MQKQIALYTADGQLCDHITQQRLARLQAANLIARVVRHRKGHVNRAVMFRRPGETKASSLRDYLGTQYSFREHLDSGHVAWKLKPLGKGDELRPIFMQVVTGCMANGGSAI